MYFIFCFFFLLGIAIGITSSAIGLVQKMQKLKIINQ